LDGKQGEWAYADIGVLVASVIGFAGYLLLCTGRVRQQEADQVSVQLDKLTR
jgi:NCS1 family nucleobase:cation symporter-1